MATTTPDNIEYPVGTDQVAPLASHFKNLADSTQAALVTKADDDDARLSDQRVPTDNSVTSAKIVNGTIVDADINTSAEIAPTKIAGTAVIDSDTRLTDARTPTAHVHSASDITSGTLDIARIPIGTVANTVADSQWVIDQISAGGGGSSETLYVKAGAALTKGQPVYISSADGTNIIVSAAGNGSEATSSKTIGLINSTVALNDFAYVTTNGILSGLNTSAATADGDPVWLGPSGTLVYGLAAKPYAPAHLVYIGVVAKKNNSTGEILINPQNGFEINELHDVYFGTNRVNGDTLVYDNGLWKNGTTNSKNYVINGGFDIWQRGTSFVGSTTNGTYGPDRFEILAGATGTTFSRQAGLSGVSQYSLRAQRNAGSTVTTNRIVDYALESSDSYSLAGNWITFSFYARKGANLSGSLLNYALYSGTGIDQSPSSMTYWPGVATVINSAASVSTDWTRYKVSADIPAGATQVGFRFSCSSPGTAGAEDWFEITGVQLERSQVATPFRRNADSVQAELAACQRYFQVIKNGYMFVQNPYFSVGLSSGPQIPMRSLPVTMRNTSALDIKDTSGSLDLSFVYPYSNAGGAGTYNIRGQFLGDQINLGYSLSWNGSNVLAAGMATGTSSEDLWFNAEL